MISVDSIDIEISYWRQSFNIRWARGQARYFDLRDTNKPIL